MDTAERSFLRRLWDALKPPPAVRPRWRPSARQKRILIATGSILGAAALAGGVWSYIASAQERAQAQFEGGMREVGAGAYRDAVTSFDRSIAIWPHNAAAFFNRGMAHRLLGESDAAIADFSRAIAENANYGGAYTERGAIAQERGDREQAMRDFSRAVELAPSANGYFQRGEAYASLGQPQKALEDFDRAIRERPDAPYIYRARAAAKRSLGDLAGYAADREQSVKIEAGEFQRAWVDIPVPAEAPAEGSTETTEPKPAHTSKKRASEKRARPAAKANRRNNRGAPGPSPPEGPPSH